MATTHLRPQDSAGFAQGFAQWEVLDPDEPGPGQSNRKAYRNRHGNRIVVEWREDP